MGHELGTHVLRSLSLALLVSIVRLARTGPAAWAARPPAPVPHRARVALEQRNPSHLMYKALFHVRESFRACPCGTKLSTESLHQGRGLCPLNLFCSAFNLYHTVTYYIKPY